MNTLFDKIRRLFAGESQNAGGKDLQRDTNIFASPAAGSDVTLDDSTLPRLMSLIEQTEEGEYACEETLDLMDEYAELVASGQDAESIMPLVKGHLEHCVDCTERYEALLNILEG